MAMVKCGRLALEYEIDVCHAIITENCPCTSCKCDFPHDGLHVVLKAFMVLNIIKSYVCFLLSESKFQLGEN